VIRVARLIRRLRGLGRDERGAVAPAVAVLAVSLIGAAGLALDIGLYYMGNRDLRSATEAAALSATMVPADAQNRATAYLERNGYDAAVLKSVEVGYYCANIAWDSSARFVPGAGGSADCPGSATQNAVRLTTEKPSRRFLTAVFGGASPIPDLAATASAARVDEAGVAITSDILRITGGSVTDTLVSTVNSVLGALLGIRLNLSAPEIQALMANNVDAGRFFDSLASRAGHTGTYRELVQGTYGMQDIAAAAAEAAYNPATATALRRFGALVGNGYRVPLANLFGMGLWANVPVGEADERTALRAGLNAYQLISFAAQAGPGAIDASDLVSLLVPGSTVSLAAVANGPMAQPRFSFGPAGEARVSTSQLRLKLQVGLPSISIPLLGAPLLEVKSLPLLIDVAPATAQVTQIACPDTDDQARDTRVTVQAESGLVRAYIADVPPAAMSKAMPEITTVTPASLLNLDVLGLVTVSATAKVVAGPVTGASSTLAFGPGGRGTIGNPQVPGTPASVRNGSQVGATVNNLIGGLGNGLDVRVSVLGGLLSLSTQAITSAVFNGLLGSITTQLTNLVGSTVDPLLDGVLAALGIQLGDATVWVTGARCGVPVLI
jgi:uncharacterized membrane protein